MAPIGPEREPSETTHVRHATRGSVAVFLGLMLSVLIGFAALGTEIVYAMVMQRRMQATASAGALSAATALMTGTPTDFQMQARAVAAAAGFTNGSGVTTVVAHNPPLAGSYKTYPKAVEVIVSQPQTLPLTGLFFAGPWNISARAVALPGTAGGDCVLALDPTANDVGVNISNGANVQLNKCGLAVNTNGSNALTVQGATLAASTISVAGQVNFNNGPSVSGTVTQNQPEVADPYSGISVPVTSCQFSGQSGQPYQVGNGVHMKMNPGVYCGGVMMSNSGDVTMSPGVYIINGGVFSVQSIHSLTGTGVTIVLTGSSTTNYATTTIANGASVTLSAPTTGTTAGLVFLAPDNGTYNGTSSFQGGTSLKFTGALYFPTQTVSYGNGSTSISTCTQLVAWKIVFNGGTAFNSNCGNIGTRTIGASPSRLVE